MRQKDKWRQGRDSELEREKPGEGEGEGEKQTDRLTETGKHTVTKDRQRETRLTDQPRKERQRRLQTHRGCMSQRRENEW